MTTTSALQDAQIEIQIDVVAAKDVEEEDPLADRAADWFRLGFWVLGLGWFWVRLGRLFYSDN